VLASLWQTNFRKSRAEGKHGRVDGRRSPRRPTYTGKSGGGLTTIEEKSLGAISKGGTKPIEDIVDYGEQLSKGGGLILMDTPGYDVESVVAKVAGGAQIIVFTTGRGSTTGNPVAPVIKVTGNPQTHEKWPTIWTSMLVGF
jgi:Altronate dehydratase